MIARQRKDLHHKQSAQLISAAGAIFTETLHVKNMTTRPKPKRDTATGQYVPNGAAAKAGLHKAIVDGAPAQFLSMLRYKAAEAGIVYAEALTRRVKPSQTCYYCGRVAKKPLAQRWHSCPCGATCSRDANAARVLLDWGMQQVVPLFLAWLWLHSNWSQELTSYLGV